MKLVKGTGCTVDLPPDLLQLGADLELIHSTKWVDDKLSSKKAYLSEALEPLDLIKTLLEKSASSVLQSGSDDFTNDVKAWIQLREQPNAYFQNPLQVLMPEGSQYRDYPISKLEEKETLRGQLMAEAAKLGNMACQEAVQVVFEELFMNAMIDAPRESGQVQSGNLTTFHLGVDDRRIGLACHDHYGSLNMKKLLARMRDVYERGAGTAINLKAPGGAGLGCTIMLEKSALVCFGVQPGQSTVVSCLIHRHLSHRRRAELKKSLHLVVNE